VTRAALVVALCLAASQAVRAQDGALARQPVSLAESSAQAQEAPQAPGPWGRFWSQVQLRQNTNVKKDIAKPAFISVTAPKEGADVLQIGAGVLAPVSSGTFFDLDALIDYQRDNTNQKEQDAFKAGATGEWRLAEMSTASNRRNTGVVTFRGNFKNDAIKTSKGWQAALGYTHLFNGQRRFPHPNLPYRFGGREGWLEVVYFPLLGLEIDRTVVARDSGDEGITVRPVGQLTTALYPAPLRLQQRIETIFSYAYRADVKDTTNASDDSHPFFTGELNLYLVKEARGEAGFGISYSRGDDPDQALAPADAWQFSFKVRLR
jgi:hypothetical protein